KRIIAVALSVVCLLFMLPALVSATTLEPSNLKLVLQKVSSDAKSSTPLVGNTLALCRVADATVDDSGAPIFSATPDFAGAGADFSDLTDTANAAYAQRLADWASKNNVAADKKVTDADGIALYANLPAGLYLVTQQGEAEDGYTIAPWLVILPDFTQGTTVTSEPKTMPYHITPATVPVSVYKTWKGSATHPASVSVQLYCDAKAYGSPVTLNEKSYWAYTWTGLDASHTWTVDESSVPAGYSKAVSGNTTDGYFITNTQTKSTPVTPKTPTSGPSYSSGGTTSGTRTPKTGDSTTVPWAVAGLSVVALLAAALSLALNSRRLAKAQVRK
ncbi:MAG: Cna B-type domain-containing protein, partial [Coriobacteriia bacterium]|nr:Cna B-type domain-containing protein [Coriobacteriia bacterium]